MKGSNAAVLPPGDGQLLRLPQLLRKPGELLLRLEQFFLTDGSRCDKNFPRQESHSEVCIMAYEIPQPLVHYPKPNRTNHRPSLDAGLGKDYQDLGWNRGVLSDGRPFRVEYWCWDEVAVLTFFMSTKGMENATDDYFRQLLVDEGLLTFVSAKPTLKSKRVKDICQRDVVRQRGGQRPGGAVRHGHTILNRYGRPD